MVIVDLKKCNSCGICIKRFDHYCISVKDRKPVINYDLCNECQKCISICPNRAFMNNGMEPDKISGDFSLTPEVFEEFLSRRRSVKKFNDRKISRDIRSASYAPNQNKNISLVIIDDNELINYIDKRALRKIMGWYKLLFKFRPFYLFALLFVSKKQIDNIKAKMELDLIHRKHIIKDNTQVMILAIGNPKEPVTKESAHYLMANMHLFSEILGVGSCLMDSLKHSINMDNEIRKKLKIPENKKVLGVIIFGYSDEKMMNIPKGYKVPVHWNEY